jgi:uracil phosphoribosyltransferase
MLMDATVATGAAAMMAIRVLLDHDVPEENITLSSLLMAAKQIFFFTLLVSTNILPF